MCKYTQRQISTNQKALTEKFPKNRINDLISWYPCTSLGLHNALKYYYTKATSCKTKQKNFVCDKNLVMLKKLIIKLKLFTN